MTKGHSLLMYPESWIRRSSRLDASLFTNISIVGGVLDGDRESEFEGQDLAVVRRGCRGYRARGRRGLSQDVGAQSQS